MRERLDLDSIGAMVSLPLPGGDHRSVGATELPVDNFGDCGCLIKGHAHIAIHTGFEWRILQIPLGSEWEYYIAQHRDLELPLALLQRKHGNTNRNWQ